MEGTLRAEMARQGRVVFGKRQQHSYHSLFYLDSLLFGEYPGVIKDSAEKPTVHPSRTSGRTEERLKIIGDVPFMLSHVEACLGFFSRIIKNL
jgi:hypothetical protein